LRESDLSDGDIVDLDDGTVITTGGVTLRRSTIGASLNFRDNRPFGWGVLARLDDTDYRGGTASTVGGTELRDTRRLTLGATARFDFNKVTTLNSSLTWQRFETEGTPGTRETVALDNTLVIDRPLGALRFGLNITNTEEGTRTGLTAGRSYEFPLGVITGSVGVTRSSSGDTFLTGDLGYNRTLSKTSAMTFGASRSVASSSTDDSERVRTGFNLGYTQELSPLAGISLGIDWANSEETFSGANTTSTTLSATYTRELTPDWDMNFGVRHRVRDDSVLGKAKSNAVFFEMSRDWVARY